MTSRRRNEITFEHVLAATLLDEPIADDVHTTLKYLVEAGKPDRLITKVLNMCGDAECTTCGAIVCPHKEPLHFHHDGCPACWTEEPAPDGEDHPRA